MDYTSIVEYELTRTSEIPDSDGQMRDLVHWLSDHGTSQEFCEWALKGFIIESTMPSDPFYEYLAEIVKNEVSAILLPDRCLSYEFNEFGGLYLIRERKEK